MTFLRELGFSFGARQEAAGGGRPVSAVLGTFGGERGGRTITGDLREFSPAEAIRTRAPRQKEDVNPT